jgi:transcriptional regulator with XRE-family HTH domain
MKTKASTLDEVFAKFAGDKEFKNEERKLRPYYDLVVEIINRRNELNLTQKDLADKAGTHQSRISKIESAEWDIRLSTLIQIAEALDTELSISLKPAGKSIPMARNGNGKASKIGSKSLKAKTPVSFTLPTQAYHQNRRSAKKKVHADA